LRKTNYRQQKKTREEARKVRKTEKLGRRQAPNAKPADDAAETQNSENKAPEAT
jgi:hypothetical protein